MAKSKSTTTTFNDLIKSIRKGHFSPVYFLYGEEAFFIDEIEKEILANALTEQEKAFNLSILYGKDIDPKNIMDHVGQFPMMAPRRLVIVREAQTLKGIDKLLPYLKDPIESSILVLCYKKAKPDGRTEFGKSIKKLTTAFESKPLRDYQVPAWVANHLKTLGYSIQQDASALIAEHTGTDISKIMNELDKLFINIPKGTTITAQHIKKYIGISREFSMFELISALGVANPARTIHVINRLEAQNNKGVLPQATSLLYNHFSKVAIYHQHKQMTDNALAGILGTHPYFVKDIKKSSVKYPIASLKRIMLLLLRYDLKGKGVDTWHMPEYALLKELSYKILQLSK